MGVQSPSTLPTVKTDISRKGIAWVLDDGESTHYRHHQLQCER